MLQYDYDKDGYKTLRPESVKGGHRTKPGRKKSRGGNGMVELTSKVFQSASNGPGGFNAKQLAILGVGWPPKKGWKKRLMGTYVKQSVASMFIAARKKSGTIGQKHSPSLKEVGHAARPEVHEKSSVLGDVIYIGRKEIARKTERELAAIAEASPY